MPGWWTLLSLLLIPALVCAQEGDEDEGGETEITISGEGNEDDRIEIVVDPFQTEREEPDEPNRPDPVEVGEWSPPALEQDARRDLERMLAARSERPDDVAVRYRLAEFYVEHGWLPQAEAEFQRAAALEPDSIRPWEGLLRLYRRVEEEEANTNVTVIVIGGQGGFRVESERPRQDPWISTRERNKRMTRAFAEIIRRRPDDIARRRALMVHLTGTGDDRAAAAQGREILARIPTDADTRFELAEAVRRTGHGKAKEEQGLGTAEWKEAQALLEANLERPLFHIRSALRLARMLYLEHGSAMEARVSELEQRAFFHLYMRRGLGAVPFQEDTLRMSCSLSGKRTANALWDAAMRPAGTDPDEWWDPDRLFYERWLYLTFPHSMPRDRSRVIEGLARRTDETVVGILLSFLWHLAEVSDPERIVDRDASARLEGDALKAATGLGPACYPGAERFLRGADTDARRRRGVALLRGLRDRRAAQPLLEALAWDLREDHSYHVAAALEELGDPLAVDGLVDAALDVRRPAARRREAAEALATFRDPRCVGAMGRLAKEVEFGLVSSYGLFRLTGDPEALDRLREGVVAGQDPPEALRLLAKCDSPAIEEVLVAVLPQVTADLQPAVAALLEERFWESARPRVLAIFLKEAETLQVSEFALATLGELGGEQAVDRLLDLLGKLKDYRWELAARALARTGDDRAVRFFSRMKILDRSEQRRELARELHELASRRRAELRSAAGE